ncbi:flagellar hook-associated protein FlgL [Paeniglutamicibacter antarcticus]|uniref:Flagellar hook-associated protein FlgL n=1 Tax=Arthrobacter terrae TaxID=2935737 RepID=A0A931G8J6_9MICC|nr:flagellar hook-associated protein FlgL [Arthrobacter terrae]MBG0740279.1 flagellar hook-associated protein FlgL [Arthrobacter terrae]
MLSRVTNQTMMASAQRNLQASNSELARLQDRAQTLKAIGRPSDDPSATARALQIRAQQTAADQYERNIDDGAGWLSTIDTAMGNVSGIMNRVRDLTVQGSNGSLNQGGRDALAAEIDGLKTDLLSQANTKYLGRNVFAGNSDAASPFPVTAPVPPATLPALGAVERRIGTDTTVRVDAEGADIFGTGTDPAAADKLSVFELLGTIIKDLKTPGVDVSKHLSTLDTRMTSMITDRTVIGTRQAQLDRAKDANTSLQGTLEASRAGVEDLDLGKAILDLQLQSTNYQAALAVTAKVLPMSLMDFLR